MRPPFALALLLASLVAAAAPPTSAAVDSSVEALADAASRECKARRPERALVHLNKCLEVEPQAPVCHRLLGSAYAQLGSIKRDAAYMEKARSAYLRFLEIAPPDDEYVPKVEAILDAAPPPAAPSSKASANKAAPGASSEEEVLAAAAARELRANQLERAINQLERCVAVAPRYAPCHRVLGSTYARLALRDGGDHNRAKARRAYERYLELAAPDDAYVPRVRVILEEAQRE